eukprot:jgi/Bigna1/33130/e_gw1.1.3.1
MQYIQGRFEEHARKFVESKNNVEERLKLVTSFRESIEIAHTSEYENFLKCLFPVFRNALREGAPMYMECNEQKIRNVLLEILNRLPNNEVLRPYVSDLLRLVMEILSIDNQENALICLRIIFDVHKNFSPKLETEVQPFINFFINLYKNLPQTVQLVFSRQPNRIAIASDGTHVKVLCKSVESFKVLTECPLIVMLLFQLYPGYVETNIHHLIPLMMRALNIQPPTNLTQQHSQLYSDFIAAQVKTLSFLTYVLRGFADRMHPHQDNLSKCVIQLLLNCPTSSINSRKELLVATRHILATNFRKGFFKKINMMLKEEVLIGQGRAHEIVRPLAYSTLADLVHHVRGDLTIDQLSKVIYIFSRNIHDNTLPLSIQTASVRLILTLVDHIYRTSDSQDRGRTLLVRILSALVNKFDTLKDYIPKLIDLVNKKKKKVQAQGHTWTLAYTPRTEEEFPGDSVREVKQLMFTMVFGLKTVVWCISNFRSHAHSSQRRPMVLDEEECRIVARFLQHGLECFKIYTIPGFTRSRSVQTVQIEKDVLEHFASVFTVLDPRSFRDVFSVQIETLFKQIVANQRLHMHMLIIPQHFLSSSNVSKVFADILLSFLTKKMKDMAIPSSESPVSLVLLNLFRIVFGSVTLFAENETVLRPYLNNIVSTAMKLIKEVKHPTNYLSLLRFLFRSIGGGKFELLYKEFLPLLPGLLQGLMHIQARGPQAIREISIELCLTVPARLSSLLQFIPLLVQAVVLALKAKDEQVIKLGLRTLEFWVDNLNPEYLYPHMCTVLSDLMRALCALLRPHPSPFGVTALSVLGKLGGRNRRFLIEAFDVDNELSSEQGLLLTMAFAPRHSFQLPMDKLIHFAGKIITRSPRSGLSVEEDNNAKKQAFLFLRTCMMRILSLSCSSCFSGVEDHVKSIQPCSTVQNRNVSTVVRNRSFIFIKEHIFKELCRCMIIASSIKHLEEDKETESKKFLRSISQHFALLFTFSQRSLGESEAYHLDAKVFLDAIVEVMCHENRDWFKASKATLDTLLNIFVQVLGKERAGTLPVLNELLSKLSHCCYQDMWETRHAGCMGLASVCDKMSPAWVRNNQGELIRAFMFTFRDSYSEFAKRTADQANASLDKVVGISSVLPANAQQKSSITKNLVTILAPELISGIYEVRKGAHRLLGLVSKLSGTTVASILMQYRTRLLAPVLQQSLHAVPMSIRIGYISAATYCLSLRPPLVTVSDLLYLLKDAIADARDENNANHSSTGIQGRTGRVQLLNRLQVEDIKLMSAALADDVKKKPPDYQDIKNNLIRVFFGSLLSRTPEIVQVAKEGLKKVIEREKLPKELLQQCMRPILLNLADIRKLCMPLLDGLSRLLELLSNCFNVTLGEKLLDHMRKFADPEVLNKMRYENLTENAGTSRMKPEDEVQVAASIIGLFHLLPPASKKFLDPLVQITLKLESILPALNFYGGYGTGSSSPYREPLIKFLVVEPQKTCEYFLKNLTQKKLSQMFQAIMRHEKCDKIRQVVMQSPEDLIRHTFECKAPNEKTRTDLIIQGIKIVHILSTFDPKWLSGCKKVVNCLINVWDSTGRHKRLKDENDLPIGHIHESKLIVECLIHYCRIHRREVRILWKMLEILLYRTLVDFTFLAEFYEKEVAQSWAPEEKKTIMNGFLRFFKENGNTQSQQQKIEQLKVKALQLIIIPILENTFKTSERTRAVLGNDMVTTLIKELVGGQQAIHYREELRVQLLRLTTLLIEHLHSQLTSYRKDLIKFAWNHLKSDNSASKQWAYVNVCRFIDVYETPPKIVLQVYVALLRTYQPEARKLVSKALDIITPALPKRLTLGKHKHPTWIKWTKKIIVEEGHLVPQLIHIWNLIIRHPDLFYQSRTQFVPQMVNSLNRLGLPQNRPPENRKLALDLADLIIRWDRKCLEQQGGGEEKKGPAAAKDENLSKRRKLENGVEKTEDKTGKQLVHNKQAASREKPFRPNSVMVELIITFLIRLGLMTCEVHETRFLSMRCSKLLEQAMKVWKGGELKFIYIQKILNAPQNQQDPSVLLTCTLEVLNILLTYQPKEFIVKHIDEIKTILSKCYHLPNLSIRKGLCGVVSKIVKALPGFAPRGGLPLSRLSMRLSGSASQPPDPIAKFYSSLRETIDTGLRQIHMDKQGMRAADRVSIHTIIALVSEISKVCTNYMDATLCTHNAASAAVSASFGHLIKATQKLARDHVQFPILNIPRGRDTTTAQRENQKAAQILDTLLMALTLIRERAHAVGDHKKNYFQTLVLLIDKSNNPKLLQHIAETVREWMSNRNRSVANFSHKERANFIRKMTRFEALNNKELSKTYLGMVLELFEAHRYIQRPEWLSKLQEPFMLGLCCKDLALKQRFRDIFHQFVPKSLYLRMNSILATQDWEPLKDKFWISQALDMLLSILVGSDPLRTGTGQNLIPAVQLEHTKYPPAHWEREGIPKNIAEILSDYTGFLQQHANLTVKDILMPMRELIHCERDFAGELWVLMISKAWSSLTNADRDMLAEPIIELLAQHWHISQQYKNPNPVQVLLAGFARCNPMPPIRPELLLYLAQTYKCWHLVLRILEDRVLRGNSQSTMNEIDNLSPDWEDAFDPDFNTASHNALQEVYHLLKEDNVMFGLLNRRVRSTYSRAALALEQFGWWTRAQDSFFAALKKLHEDQRLKTGGEAESAMWQSEWIKCARHLNQWKVLSDFSRTINHPEMQLDCSWRQSEWERMKEIFGTDFPNLPSAAAASTSAATAKTMLYYNYMVLHDRKSHDDTQLESLLNQSVQKALSEWQKLPNFVSNSHTGLLHRFHILVELKESIGIIHELNNYRRQNQVPNLKTFITTWRERLPNKWEEIPVWSEVTTWRNQMFNLITSTFPINDMGHSGYSRMHDIPWTFIKFAQIARKQHLSTVCLTSLAKLYRYPSMEAMDAFSKLREHIKCCLQSPMEIRAALNIISKTNLEYFSNEQKAEIFRLKGEALQHLGYGDESNTAFSAAISICDSYGKAWLSWAIFCDRVFTLKQDLQWAKHAVVCYLQAIRHKKNRARLLIARILWLLSYDLDQGPVNQAFKRYTEHLPSWIWLLWIPQLLSSLARPEGLAVKNILCKIAQQYPQALYYTVRAYLIEKREIRNTSKAQQQLAQQQQQQQQQLAHRQAAQTAAQAQALKNQAMKIGGSAGAQGAAASASAAAAASGSKKGSDLSSSSGSGHSSNAIKWVEDVVSVLRRSHPTLMTEVEKMLDEFSRRFKPEPEEELLGAVHALILKCFKQQLSRDDKVPHVLQTTIKRVCRKFFTPDPKMGNKKHLAFVQKYKRSFEHDFLPEGSRFPLTLGILLKKLKRWKAHLQYKVGERSQIYLRLEKLSPYLIRFQSYDIEIPGQYLTDQEPQVDQNVVLHRFHPDVKVHHTHGFSHRRIGMRGNDGKRYSFLVQYSISHITRSDERMMQVYVLFNRMMAKYKETRNRNLVFHVPLVVPLTHRLRLMQTNEAHISLEEVYEQSCAVRRVDPDQPLLTYREILHKAEGCEQNAKARLKAYDTICHTVVPDYILSRFIDRVVRAPDQYWAFKKEFAAQIAISGFLSYIMNIGDRSLYKLSFSKKSGRIINSEFYPAYNAYYLIDCQESVPFRLTRNITTFLTPLMVDGIVSSVLTAANSCLLRNQDVIRNYLCLFIRDDLLSWNSTKMSMPDDRGQRQLESQLRDKIRNNVSLIIKRLHVLMPSQSDTKVRNNDSAINPPMPMNYKVSQLIKDATDKERLCMMSSTWQPWF